MTEQTTAEVVPEWDLSDRLRKGLTHAGISSNEMAEYLEVTRHTISNWINGRTRPRPAELKMWALRTGVSYRWLVSGAERPVANDFGSPSDVTNVDKPSGLHATADEPISTEEIMRFRKRIPPKPRPVDVVDTRMAAIS